MAKRIITDDDKVIDIVTRGVEDVFVKESLISKLKSGKELRIKMGIDPTGPTIHLGRAVVLRKLKAFQDLGHKPVLVIGDFTTQIGDPSDKLEKRPMLSLSQVKENMKNYKKIIGKVIDLSRAEVHFNSRWLNKLNFQQVAELAESFTVQQMLARRNFSDRYESGQEISLREFLYPLMQGFDSVAIKADVELGGFDQLFNLKAGRVIQRHFKQTEQDVMTLQMLEGTDGRKMSTSWGNVVNITDEPFLMYGKIMALKDELIEKYFLLCTDFSLKEIASLKGIIKTNPKDAKMSLAREIVAIYHGPEEAKKAEDDWKRAFEQKTIPESAKKVTLKIKAPLADIAIKNGLVESKSEFFRLVKDGAITFSVKGTEKKIIDPKSLVSESGDLKVGKKRFLSITIQKKK